MNQQIKTIRIFISSTFRDMHSERDYLVKYVFPELRDRCIKKGLSLVDVDLRWGVTEEEAEQGKAIEICLDEIENCKPFFIGILGERYGWTPETYQVPDYKKYDWLRKFEKGHSITALEIYHGVLNKKEMKPRAFFYYRNPAFIAKVPLSKQAEVKAESDLVAKKLINLKADIKDIFALNNIPGHIMPAYPCKYKGLKMNLQLVKDLLSTDLTKQDINQLETLTDKDNLIDNKQYETLNEKLKKLVDQYSYVYLEGLVEFGNEVLENIWEAICDEHPDENIVTDPLLIEQAYHQRFMNSRTRGFIGREDVLGEIADYVNDTSIRKPLMVMGEPGSGKSAIMAVAAQRNEDKTNAGFTIIRFVGASPASLDIIKLVQNIIRKTAVPFEINIDEERINDVKVLYEYFREVLYTASTKGKLTLFIDAVNQLLPQYEPHYLLWLPKYLPENVKMVISSIESEYTKNAIKYNLPFVQVKELAPDNCKKIIHDTLYEYRKELTSEQMEVLLSKTDAVKPLYLKVACEELRVFPSFELINSRIARLPDTIAELFEQFLERLEADHNPKLVKDTLCLIESSMYGLLESELLELLKPADKEKLPVNIWAKLYRNLSPYLMNAGDEKEGLLEFFHLQLSSAVQTRYLAKDAISYNKRLADYGLQKYNLKNGNTINTVLYTGIYLYKSLEENTLYELLRDVFTLKSDSYGAFRGIADNLYDWVVNKYNFKIEIILKSINEKLAKNDVSFQLLHFLEINGMNLSGFGKHDWQLYFHQTSLKVIQTLEEYEPFNLDLKEQFSRNLFNLGFILSKSNENEAAIKYFEYSLKKIEEIISIQPTRTDIKRYYTNILRQIGGVYESVGCNNESMEYYIKSLEITKSLCDADPNNIDFKNDLSINYNYLGCLFSKIDEVTAKQYNEKSLIILEELLRIEPRKQKYIYELAVLYNNIGCLCKSMRDIDKAKEYFKKQMISIESLKELSPEKIELYIDYAHCHWNMFIIYEGAEKFSWLDKTRQILEELTGKGVDNVRLAEFTTHVNNAIKAYIKTEVLSTLGNYFKKLTSLALITDNLTEAALQTNEVWKTRKEAKNYVVARILWFKLSLVFLNTATKQNKSIFSKLKSLYKKEVRNETAIILSKLKVVLQNENAVGEWTMQRVLDNIKPKISEHQYALLSALVDAMSNKENLEKLNEFEEWRNAEEMEID